MKASEKNQLSALLVGIDRYPEPVTALKGCVHDVRKMAGYLENEKSYFNVLVTQLTDEKATKSAIIDNLKELLTHSAPGDSVLFYYSGHGTQEEADPVFWPSDPDKKLEALVCHDSISSQDGSTQMHLLADKELRYLLKKYAVPGVHITTIFDCCHSGSNTRNGNVAASGYEVLERRYVNRERMGNAFPKRDWEDFVFAKEIRYGQVGKAGLEAVFPEAGHIQMAACQNDESAYEVNGEGVFTKNLVDILTRSGGKISYHRLQGAIQSYLRHQFQQTPKLYSSTGNGLFHNFLNKGSVQEGMYGTVSHNEGLGWILDMGAMQGMATGKKLDLETAGSKEKMEARINEVYGTYSTISFLGEDSASADKKLGFKTEITDALTYGLQLYADSEATSWLQTTHVFEKIRALPFLNLATAPAEADYCLISSGGSLLLSAPENIQVPLVPKIPKGEQGLDGLLGNYLAHLSKFNFVKYLNNPSGFLLQPSLVSLQVFNGEDDQAVIPITGNNLFLSYKKTGSGWGGSIRIKLQNTSNRKLYCALCYLSFNHGVFTNLLKAGVEGLDVGREAWSLDGAPILLKLEPEVVDFKYKESRAYLKLILSTEDFTQQLSTFSLEDLPSPLNELKAQNRGLQTTNVPEAFHDWATRLVTLHIPNPQL